LPYTIHSRAKNKSAENPQHGLLLPISATLIQHILPDKRIDHTRTPLHTGLPNSRAKATLEKKVISAFNSMSTETT